MFAIAMFATVMFSTAIALFSTAASTSSIAAKMMMSLLILTATALTTTTVTTSSIPTRRRMHFTAVRRFGRKSLVLFTAAGRKAFRSLSSLFASGPKSSAENKSHTQIGIVCQNDRFNSSKTCCCPETSASVVPSLSSTTGTVTLNRYRSTPMEHHSYNVNISAFNITTESAAAASEGSKYANVVTAISKLSGKGVFKVILVMLVGIGFGITLFMLSSQVSTYLGSLTSFLGSFFKQKP